MGISGIGCILHGIYIIYIYMIGHDVLAMGYAVGHIDFELCYGILRYCMLLVTENHMGLYKQLDMILGCVCVKMLYVPTKWLFNGENAG